MPNITQKESKGYITALFFIQMSCKGLIFIIEQI